MKITYLGHASLLIETQGKCIVVDPFIKSNPAASSIDIKSLKPDFILITHAHMDHVADVQEVAVEGTKLIAVFEIATYFGNRGIDAMGMNTGGKAKFDFGTLKLVTAHHSSVFHDGVQGGNPVGFVLWNEEGCIYIAGDTALTLDMKLIPQMCPPLDLAILPIGDYFTMGYEDAALAAEFVQCKRVLGYHYDTFPPIKIDHAKAKAYFEERGLELVLLPIGQSIEV